jgi:DNA-binding transcriptional regulator LsrR (DeoR family)
MAERLGDDGMREIVRSYEAGVIQVELAERYGISLSSVKRILRRHRAAEAEAN